MSRARLAIAVLPGIAGVAGGWWYVQYTALHPTTADAYIGRHVVQIAPQVSGPVQQVAIATNQPVKAGDLLFTIDPTPFALTVRQAEARLQQPRDSRSAADAQVSVAKAQMVKAEANNQDAERHAERHAERIRGLVA